jgi:hypothetical protein
MRRAPIPPFAVAAVICCPRHTACPTPGVFLKQGSDGKRRGGSADGNADRWRRSWPGLVNKNPARRGHHACGARHAVFPERPPREGGSSPPKCRYPYLRTETARRLPDVRLMARRIVFGISRGDPDSVKASMSTIYLAVENIDHSCTKTSPQTRTVPYRRIAVAAS